MATSSEGVSKEHTLGNMHSATKLRDSLGSSILTDASVSEPPSVSASGPSDPPVDRIPNPRLEQMKQVMADVYGAFHQTFQQASTDDPAASTLMPTQRHAAPWKPRPYIEGHKGRYLWTDAYGVCNFITLYCETKEIAYLEQAEALIKDVHDTLGKTRDGKKRLGRSTDEHPLLGGLRIGKPDPEGSEDGDGQYFHYLTKWMFALNRMSWVKNEIRFNDWAVELAKAIQPHFVYQRESNAPRMYWKMSIDLLEPLVLSEGNLDPFDGYVTYRLLQERSINPGVLANEIEDMRKMVWNKYRRYSSNDALDLGEALWLSHWYPREEWALRVAAVSSEGVERLYSSGRFSSSKRYRLAFRELGTTIGVQVNEKADPQWAQRVEELHSFWAKDLYGRDRDITPVMFCTSLVPGAVTRGYAENKAQQA